jgi:Ca2+-binding EF-hand superfamily protein
MASKRNADAIAEVFNRYDPDKKGYITKQKLKDCIFDLNGRTLDDTELNQIFELLQGDKEDNVHLREFIKVMETFFRYC